MSAFADLLDLQTAVVEQVRDPSIVDVFPRLIALAETGFNRRLRCGDQVIIDIPVIVVGGSGALPSDVAEIIGVYDTAGCEYIAQPLQATKGHQPRGYYAVFAGNIIAPVDETLTVDYYAKIPTLAGDLTNTNWLLEKHPGLYLYGVGVEAAKYLRDVEAAQATQQLVEMEYAAIAADDAQARYSRARVRVPGVVP